LGSWRSWLRKLSNMKKNIAIIFGGKSAEHEVSLQSAKNIYEAMDKDKYNPVLIGIDKNGIWHRNEAANFLLNAENPELIKLNTAGEKVSFVPESRGELLNLESEKVFEKIDVAFPIVHGPLGEDGVLQGFLKLAGIPFVGPSVLGSAVGMDKQIMKVLLRDAGLNIGKFITLKSHEERPLFEDVKEQLGTAIFIKPANMGSSVGISKVTNEEEYTKALDDAFLYDSKILIEEAIVGREIECSVLGNEYPRASVPGEVIAENNFYSYDAKYISDTAARTEIPAKNISEEKIKEIQRVAIKTFQALSCEGMGRVDMFLKESGEVIVNEMNTLPGFTKISMYPKMWEASGLSYTDLISLLIELAIERFERESKLKRSVS